jgi:hypothetical protein
MMEWLAVLGRLPFSFFVFIAVMLLMLGSDMIYGEMAMQMNTVMQIYMMMLLFAAVKFTKTEHKAEMAAQALPSFMFLFISSILIMSIVGPMIQGVLVASTLEASIQLAFAYGLMHAFVKAYVEEEVFRGRLVVLLGEVGQAVAFGLFHFFVLFMILGWSPMLFASMFWLMGLGYLWGKVEDRWGLAGSTGSHFGYNLVVMGIAPFIFGAAVI